MQLLNCLLALGGDQRNTVPKVRITTAEAHVLRAIHGDDSVHDVEPLDEEVDIKPREEISRLAEKYVGKDEDGRPIVGVVFAGGGAGMPMTVADLDLPEAAFKVVSRVTAMPASGQNVRSADDMFT